MTYCPLCVPEVGISEDGKCVVVRYYPEEMMDLNTLETRTFELDTGLHIIREGWFKDFEKTEDNMLTYEVIHPIKDWETKHMMNQGSVNKEIETVMELI